MWFMLTGLWLVLQSNLYDLYVVSFCYIACIFVYYVYFGLHVCACVLLLKVSIISDQCGNKMTISSVFFFVISLSLRKSCLVATLHRNELPTLKQRETVKLHFMLALSACCFNAVDRVESQYSVWVVSVHCGEWEPCLTCIFAGRKG